MQQQQYRDYNEDNICSKSLLVLVARGNAIITELHRLIELVPAPFKHHHQASTSHHHHHHHHQHEQQPPVAQQFLDREKKFTLDDIICDFSYFKNSETFEAKIELNETLKKADENFCDNFIDILTRFYLTFESVQRYAADLNNFILELEEDAFVGQSLDNLLLETESRQLLCEAFFLLGYMLITTDNNFEGGLRERLIVSYYRYSSYKSSPGFGIDDTCHLMRSTGYRSFRQQIYRTGSAVQHFRPEGYPESFFSRVGVNQSVVNILIAKLQSVDIYNQTALAFPHPDHRSTALSQQASILHVILYFCPNILDKQRSRMREITDKFFHDNWIISLYMGELVNLVEAWEPYKAARESLSQLVEIETTKTQINDYNLKFYRVHKHLQDYLRDGWLNENSVLEHHVKILNQMREANVLIRWVLIHSHMQSNWQLKLTKALHSLVIKNRPDLRILYEFLQDLSELEKKFSNIYDMVLNEKSERMEQKKTRALDTLSELVEIFNDSKPMRWIQAGANSKLVELLVRFKTNLEKFDLANVQTHPRDSIINLINELDSAQESYSDGKNLQVIQLFMDTKNSLMLILRYLSLTNEIKIMLQSIGDFSYAWKIMDETFTPHMQQLIKDNPLKVHRIESMFLKLASAFDTYLIRIQQVNAQADLISVSQYYSTKLISYIRDVLHIIPATIFELVTSIVSIQTNCVMSEMPSKVSSDELRDYALPGKRFSMLELTYKISHYAESMLMMQDTTIGLIRINSKQLLEDGIRRELVKRMFDSIHTSLEFIPSSDHQNNVSSSSSSAGNHPQITGSQQQQLAQSLLNKLTRLNSVMNGYKRSFEYLQDFLFIYGLRIWQEELSRIVKFNLEQATEALLDEGALSSDGYQYSSLYQSTRAPIPTYSVDPLKSSFLVKILDELSRITDPRLTIYDEQMSAWYDQKAPRDKVMDLKVFELIGSSLCITGLNGLDQMCCAYLVSELQKLDTLLVSMATNTTNSSSSAGQVKALFESLGSISSLRDYPKSADNRQPSKLFSAALVKVAPNSEKLTNHLLRIGQLQAIRTNISCVLSTRCRYEARNLYNCLETLNTSLMSTLRCGKKESSSQQKLEMQRRNTAKEAAATLLQASGSSLDQLVSSPGGDVSHNLSTATAARSDEQMDGSERSDNENAEKEEEEEEKEEEDNNNSLADCSEEDSQLLFELTNHLEWIGLSDPLSKVYTLELQASSSSEEYEFRQQLAAIDLIFLIVLDQCSKFNFSRKISGFVPRQSKSFYESSHTVDGQPLFYGLMTLINHYRPYLPTCSSSSAGACSADDDLGGGGGVDGSNAATVVASGDRDHHHEHQFGRQLQFATTKTANKSSSNLQQAAGTDSPLARLLERMSLFVKYSFLLKQQTSSGGIQIKPQELTLELVNMILAMIELTRLGRQSSSKLLSGACLPDYLLDTFQFTVCHLNRNGSS